jgi:flagellar basal body-associated protein FliL
MIALGLYVVVMVCMTVGYYFTLISLKEKQDREKEQKPETKQERKQLQEYDHV